MNSFSRYLVIPQYFYFENRDMLLINTAHPYFVNAQLELLICVNNYEDK